MSLSADEGMWTFDNIPTSEIYQKYRVKINKAQLQKIRLSSVRLNNGGSGSFVSPAGLVLTNHHVALSQLQKLSNEKTDLIKNGFYARTLAEEIACPDLEMNVLISYEDVTTKVLTQINPKNPPSKQVEQKNEIFARLKKQSFATTGLRSDIVTLYNGGEYWLYRYKQYTDIKLVMAPNLQLAFFGGNEDNFQYPRYSLDFAFFRVYENGKPLESKNYLSWSRFDITEKDPLFVSGHPGRTSRQKTLYEITFLRDRLIPAYMAYLKKKEDIYHSYLQKHPEDRMKLNSHIFMIENAKKSFQGQWQALQEPEMIAKKKQQQDILQKFLKTNPKLKREIGNPWQKIRLTIDKKSLRINDFFYTGSGGSRMAGYAILFMLYAQEMQKPDHKRLRAFQQVAQRSLQLKLLSPAPIYPDIEQFIFQKNLQLAQNVLGKDHPYIKLALRDKPAKLIAELLFSKSQIHRLEFRKKLFSSGPNAILKSRDPFLLWAAGVASFRRKFHQWQEKTIDIVLKEEGNHLTKLRFAKYGKEIYPDATFSLRFSYGQALGYQTKTGRIPFRTTFYGLVNRSLAFGQQKPYHLPKIFLDNLSKLDLATPLNIISNNDITGGNSGSPVLNKNFEITGLVFDGNYYSHGWDYAYSDEKGRCVLLSTRAIIETLAKLYRATPLIKEIQNID